MIASARRPGSRARREQRMRRHAPARDLAGTTGLSATRRLAPGPLRVEGDA